ncbi:MAG: transposase, partial [Spirochaetaceae bacterium]|jgi:REP element-mobilizing transposase RayT|nr:transposase [Spirochaetaceae bacterium]
MLKQGVWYEISTRVNNREPLFRRGQALALFGRVFRETAHRFAFAVRGLGLAGDRLAFYIKPADGFELPAIMKWLKQTFAQRYNRDNGRTGHLWGGPGRARIRVGGPPDGGGAGEAGGPPACGVRPRGGKRASGPAAAGVPPAHGVRPRRGKRVAGAAFSRLYPLPVAPAPG